LPSPDADRRLRRRRFLFAATLTLGVGLLVLLFVLSDWRKLLHTAAHIRPGVLALPFALTLVSYAAMARSYQGIADVAECRLGFRAWLRITFVSNTANYLVTSAGLSGFALRMYLLARQGVPSNRAVLISLVQTFFTNFTLLLFLLGGLATVVAGGSLRGPELAAAESVVVAFAVILAFAAVLAVHRRLRRRVLFFLADAGHRLLRRIVPRWTPGRVRFWRFQHSLNAGLEFLFARKRRMATPAAWILIDWVLTMAILWAAFRAVNHPIAPGIVVIGFAVGICLSLVSIVPGGLGIMEGSMVAVFHSLGVDYDAALVAVLIFRLAYYALPLLVSLFFFHGVMLQALHGVQHPAPGVP
jgi:uncharacterized protein (TIRG00374 family)